MVLSFKALAAAGSRGSSLRSGGGSSRGTCRGFTSGRVIGISRRWRGLKVRIVLGFLQCGAGPEDPHWIALPLWVPEEMNKNPNLAYSDRYGRRSIDYVSLGCDILPVFRGRSPIQAYADFMRNFRDAFSPFFGEVISAREMQVVCFYLTRESSIGLILAVSLGNSNRNGSWRGIDVSFAAIL